MTTFSDSPSSSSSLPPLTPAAGVGTGTFPQPAAGTENSRLGDDSGADFASSSASGTSTAHAGDDMLERVVRSAHATIDRLAETAAPHVHRLQESMSSAGDSLHERAGQAREVGDEWTETLRCTVRDNPLAALATALAVGVLIARLTADNR